MLTLTIASAIGTATIPDTGTSGYVLISYGPGQVRRDNAYAESRWIDGAALVSSRTDLTSLSLAVRVFGTSVDNALENAGVLLGIVTQDDYTVTTAYVGGGSAVQHAMPASYSLEYDPNFLRVNQALLTLDIPVQP